jgi:hypothetical protein
VTVDPLPWPRDSAPEPSGHRRFLEVVTRFEAAHTCHDLDAFRSFLHEEALIESIAGGGVRTADETVEGVRSAFAAGVYSKGDWEFEEVAEDVVLAAAPIRYATENGLRDRVNYWLITGRDGLVWRIRIFRARTDALAYFDEHGHSLGL